MRDTDWSSVSSLFGRFLQEKNDWKINDEHKKFGQSSSSDSSPYRPVSFTMTCIPNEWISLVQHEESNSNSSPFSLSLSFFCDEIPSLFPWFSNEVLPESDTVFSELTSFNYSHSKDYQPMFVGNSLCIGSQSDANPFSSLLLLFSLDISLDQRFGKSLRTRSHLWIRLESLWEFGKWPLELISV